MTAEALGALRAEGESLEQYGERIAAKVRREMMDRLEEDVIGCLGQSHIIFGKACAMEAVTTAMDEVGRGIALARRTSPDAAAMREACAKVADKMAREADRVEVINMFGVEGATVMVKSVEAVATAIRTLPLPAPTAPEVDLTDALAMANPQDGVAIPAGMKPWRGGDSPPEDWNGGPVWTQPGAWLRNPEDYQCWAQVIAYTPRLLERGERSDVNCSLARDECNSRPLHPATASTLSPSPTHAALFAGDEERAGPAEWVNSLPGVRASDQFIALDRRALEAMFGRALAFASSRPEEERLRGALEAFVKLERRVLADLSTAHNSRGPGASSEMRSDDRDDMAEAKAAFAAARAALRPEGVE